MIFCHFRNTAVVNNIFEWQYLPDQFFMYILNHNVGLTGFIEGYHVLGTMSVGQKTSSESSIMVSAGIIMTPLT